MSGGHLSCKYIGPYARWMSGYAGNPVDPERWKAQCGFLGALEFLKFPVSLGYTLCLWILWEPPGLFQSHISSFSFIYSNWRFLIYATKSWHAQTILLSEVHDHVLLECQEVTGHLLKNKVLDSALTDLEAPYSSMSLWNQWYFVVGTFPKPILVELYNNKDSVKTRS